MKAPEQTSASFWLIGEAPPPKTSGQTTDPLTPDGSGLLHTANRLLALTGWSLDLFLAIFPKRMTLWDNPNRVWMPIGRDKARQIVAEVQKKPTLGVVLMGGLTAKAFGLEDEEPFEWFGKYSVIPHPTGRCKFWQTDGAHERAHHFFEELRCKHESVKGVAPPRP